MSLMIRTDEPSMVAWSGIPWLINIFSLSLFMAQFIHTFCGTHLQVAKRSTDEKPQRIYCSIGMRATMPNFTLMLWQVREYLVINLSFWTVCFRRDGVSEAVKATSVAYVLFLPSRSLVTSIFVIAPYRPGVVIAPRLSLLLICVWTWAEVDGVRGDLDVSLSCCDIYELFSVDYFTCDLNMFEKSRW
jgi:hypothetical protein